LEYMLRLDHGKERILGWYMLTQLFAVNVQAVAFLGEEGIRRRFLLRHKTFSKELIEIKRNKLPYNVFCC